MSSRSSSTLVAPYRLLVKPTEGESAVTQVQAAATRLEDALQVLSHVGDVARQLMRVQRV